MSVVLLVLTRGEKDNGAVVNELHVVPLLSAGSVQFSSANGLVRVAAEGIERVVIDVGVVPELEEQRSATHLFIRVDGIRGDALGRDRMCVQQGVSLEDDEASDATAIATFRDVCTVVAFALRQRKFAVERSPSFTLHWCWSSVLRTPTTADLAKQDASWGLTP
jgi:hypothetical protein